VANAPARHPGGAGAVSLRHLVRALARKRGLITLLTMLALLFAVIGVNMVTPRYGAETRILIDGGENVFLRPLEGRLEEQVRPDAEAMTSQVQLVLSRDLAREIVWKDNLLEKPEFDPVLRRLNPIKSFLLPLGIGRDPFSMSPEERVLEAYYDRLSAYAIDRSRVIVIEFQSFDPDLAAQVANSIADSYLLLQRNARQDQVRSAKQWLSSEIERLRKKVSEAETRVEELRSDSSRTVGAATTLSDPQMGELNTQLNSAQAMKADAEAKARLIREMLRGGGPVEASEVLNSDLMRRLTEQRVTRRAQLAEKSSTLLGNHPQIKELKAQLNDLDSQIRAEAGKISRSLENEARIAGGRVERLTASLDQLRKKASSSNGQDVQLHALEREARAQRDLLESYLAKFRQANARENIDVVPAAGRIISTAVASNRPAFPKKLPIVLIATLGTLLISCGVVVTAALLRFTAMETADGQDAVPAPMAGAPVESPDDCDEEPDQDMDEDMDDLDHDLDLDQDLDADLEQDLDPDLDPDLEPEPTREDSGALAEQPVTPLVTTTVPAKVQFVAPERPGTHLAEKCAAEASLVPELPRFEARGQDIEEAAAALKSEPPSAARDGAELNEIEQLAQRLRKTSARKATVLGTATGERITLTALTLGRFLASDRRVVLIDLAAASTAVAAASGHPLTAGLTELIQGEASFTDVIRRDRMSKLHLVVAGRPGFDRRLLRSAHIDMAIDALLQVYEYVIVDVGVASDLRTELMTSHACAVLVPDPSLTPPARTRLVTQLGKSGFSEVLMLSGAINPAVAFEAGLRMAAA